MHRFLVWACAAGIAWLGCSGDASEPDRKGSGSGPPATTSEDSEPTTGACVPDLSCAGSMEINRTCNGNQATDTSRDCAASGQRCYPDVGCAACQPNVGICQGNDAMVCKPDGTGYAPPVLCDLTKGEVCLVGACTHPCEQAEANQSYIGCEYWPTPVLNSQLDREFEFAAVVANPQAVPASVTIGLGARELLRVEVPVGGARAITLPWIADLKGTPQQESSAVVSPGAYRLTSNVPVSVYQFNPLEFRIPNDCESEHDPSIEDSANPQIDGECFSYSNDASLLLPTHVLSRDYIIVSRPAMVNRIQNDDFDVLTKSPGFFTVVGAEPQGTDVTIEVTAHVVASIDGMIQALAPGDLATVRLKQGDVLQVVTQAPDECVEGVAPADALGAAGSNVVSEIRSYCSVGGDYDLTGSEVHASGKVAVIAGHNCSFVPYGRWACDHQEEQLFPLQAWGKDYLVSVTKPLREEPNVIRIVSGDDGNEIAFTPAVAPPMTLARGQMFEFETSVDFNVTGSRALMVAQFLVGQDYAGILSAGPMGLGDPSLSLAIPTEQFRASYTILVPESYELNLINVTARAGSQVLLDGQAVAGFVPVPGTSMATARIEISKGQHDLRADEPFGVVSYGFGLYTSYMYPAGLDLKRINDVN
jgi:hypothetical protein